MFALSLMRDDFIVALEMILLSLMHIIFIFLWNVGGSTIILVPKRLVFNCDVFNPLSFSSLKGSESETECDGSPVFVFPCYGPPTALYLALAGKPSKWLAAARHYNAFSRFSLIWSYVNACNFRQKPNFEYQTNNKSWKSPYFSHYMNSCNFRQKPNFEYQTNNKSWKSPYFCHPYLCQEVTEMKSIYIVANVKRDSRKNNRKRWRGTEQFIN